MLAISRSVCSRSASAKAASPVYHVTRRFASDKAIRTRMTAVANIKKITRAMKMVASAKLRRCEDVLNTTRAFSAGLSDIFGNDETRLVAAPEPPTSRVAEAAVAATTSGVSTAPANSVTVVAFTPDRGLCGSVSSAVTRATRNRINHLLAANKTVTLVTIGEKGRAHLDRAFRPHFGGVISEHSKLKRRQFKQSMLIADVVLRQDFEMGEIVYNQYRNMISFETRIQSINNAKTAVADPKMGEGYELEGGSDVLENLYELVVAARVHSLLAESDMVEFSQRVNSMGNSSKSAEDMLTRLKLLYNRSRQSRITTELVEIISGAVASEDQQKNA